MKIPHQLPGFALLLIVAAGCGRAASDCRATSPAEASPKAAVVLLPADLGSGRLTTHLTTSFTTETDERSASPLLHQGTAGNGAFTPAHRRVPLHSLRLAQSDQ